jgi:flotillin
VKPAAAEAQAVIARAEGAKRARIASAEADAETTRLEGGAEAQIVLTKGEAEAKALAMRAEAYKQFNEAAIIQTVLSALPDIVRAASEPMGHINSLTVMSADGASELVKNATRAVVESSTAIKGLTGLDVPSLIGGAMGRGFGDRLRTGEGAREGDGRNAVGTAAEEIMHKAASGLTTMPARASASAAEVEAKAKEDETAAAEAAQQAAAKIAKATATAEAKATAVKAALDAKVAPSEGNAAQWAKWLAQQLKQIPQIQLFGSIPLSQLAERGPAQAQVIWHTAENVMGKDYGKMTVAELISKFGS